MKFALFRSHRTLAAIGLVSLVALAAYQLSMVLEPRLRMRVDSQRDPLVVLVLIDALRRDHVETLGSDRATTPELARLAQDGFVASKMLAHSSQTAPSVASMFTATPPYAHGVQYDSHTKRFGNDGRAKAPMLAEDNLTLAEVLSNEGYYTAAAVANPWLRKEFGFAQGFDEYVEIECHKRRLGICDGARVNKEGVRVIREHPKGKTFLYLHYLDVHNPYAHAGRLPKVFRKGDGRVVYRNGKAKVSDADLAYTIDAYDDGLRYTDSLIGELVKELEAAAAERDVLLVITSDHGDEFLEHGGLGHGTTLYPELLETFAIFWRPEGRMKHTRDARLSGMIDIAPTMLDLLGTKTPAEMDGRSLLGPLTPQTVVSELASKKAAIDGDLWVIRDLRNGKETVIVNAGSPTTVPPSEELRELGATLDALEVRETPVTDGIPDPAVVQQLKALGYIE